MTCAMAKPGNRIRLWSPHPLQLRGRLRDAIAGCLAEAFASGAWARKPMPVGDGADPHSARGIIAQLGACAEVLVASHADGQRASHGNEVVGCVLGSVLDDALIETYRLAGFGARNGDGLLAYIGLTPAAQGSRAFPLGTNEFALWPRQDDTPSEQGGKSLAGLLFARWLELSAIGRCPRVFVRTRKVLRPIRHLAEKNGFHYRGRFELDYRGERQDRMVFERANA